LAHLLNHSAGGASGCRETPRYLINDEAVALIAAMDVGLGHQPGQM